MSKKTDNIYNCINELNIIQEQLEKISKDFEMGEGSASLDDLQFQMKQNLRNLKFWIDSLYSYNGKSTSKAKQSSSRENGKKGGRPPKQITEAKKRILEIENTLIPELEHKIKFSNDFLEEEKARDEIKKLGEEKTLLENKLTEWKCQK